MKVKKISNVTLVENFFSQGGNMRTHIKSVHEGQKDFKCNYCGKNFSQAGNVRKHIKKVH